jgi:hypothetical protein
LIETSELQHLDLTGMNFTNSHLKSIIRSISKSKHLLAAHLSNNELVEEIHDGYPLKVELLSILGINFQHWKMMNHEKRLRGIKAMKMVDREGWLFNNIEPKEE